MGLGYYNPAKLAQGNSTNDPGPGNGSKPVVVKATASPRQSRRSQSSVKAQAKAAGSTTTTGEATILGYLPEGSMILDKVHADLYRRQGFEIRRLEEALGECRSKLALQAGHFKP